MLHHCWKETWALIKLWGQSPILQNRMPALVLEIILQLQNVKALKRSIRWKVAPWKGPPKASLITSLSFHFRHPCGWDPKGRKGWTRVIVLKCKVWKTQAAASNYKPAWNRIRTSNLKKICEPFQLLADVPVTSTLLQTFGKRTS